MVVEAVEVRNEEEEEEGIESLLEEKDDVAVLEGCGPIVVDELVTDPSCV